MITREIRKKYIEYFKSLDHVDVGSASLVPENDPTTLFTGSGMQPLIPYLLGENHPSGVRLVNSQRCFRSEDIDEVGDNSHTTFFEMLGNWSLGDYFKEQQLTWLWHFLTKEINLDPNRLYATVFAGDKQAGIDKDAASIEIWTELFKKSGIDNKVVFAGSRVEASERGMQEGRIFVYDAEKNWWSRAGAPETMPAGEPGGPDSEIFYDFGTPHNESFGKECHPNCDCGRFMEIGNSVFMEYIKNKTGGFDLLPRKNVDFGGGLERLTAASNNNADIYMIDVLKSIIEDIEIKTSKKYTQTEYRESFRVAADHIRGAVFMLGDGVLPSNTDRGYFVRRLLRRLIRHMDMLGAQENAASELVATVVVLYSDHYTHLKDTANEIQEAISKEEEKFRSTLKSGLVEFGKRIKESVTGHDAWYLFMTYGFPPEMTKDLAKEHNVKIADNFEKQFEENKKKHQDTSKIGAEKKFKGGLADQSEMSIKYHTATHLLHAALRKILGEHAVQSGSNITAERLRFDFKHDAKLTPAQISAVEEEVNAVIRQQLNVVKEEMTLEEAKQRGAVGLFDDKYGNKVSVYSVGEVSIEMCGGPHVENTGQLGTFRVIKEESAGAGVRRIKAVLE